MFSLMGNVLSDERNRLVVNNVKSELCGFFNTYCSCTKFKDAISSNIPSLNAVTANAECRLCQYFYEISYVISYYKLSPAYQTFSNVLSCSVMVITKSSNVADIFEKIISFLLVIMYET